MDEYNSNDNSRKDMMYEEIHEEKKEKEVKRFNLYSTKSKIISIVIIGIILIVMLCNIESIRTGNNFLFSNYNIDAKFNDYCYDVVDAKLNLQDANHIEEIYLKKYENGEIEKQDLKYMISSRINDLKIINDQLNNTVNFVYLIINKETGEIFETNIYTNPNIEYNDYTKEYKYKPSGRSFFNPVDLLRNTSINYSSLEYYSDFRNLMEEIRIIDKYDVHFALFDPNFSGFSGMKSDEFNDIYGDYVFFKRIILNASSSLGICCILLIIPALYLMIVAGRNKRNGELKLQIIDKFPIEIYALIAMFSIIILSEAIGSYTYSWIYSPFFIIVLIIAPIIVVTFLCSVSRRFKAKILFKTSLTYYIIRKLNPKAKAKKTKFSLFPIIGLIVLNGGWYLVSILYVGNTSDYEIVLFLLFIVFLDVLFIIPVIKMYLSFKKLTEIISSVSNGDIDIDIDKNKLPQMFKPLVEDIENIQSGLANAVDKAIKGERLKTELITNVSHDLKTPLTSIINYVDLLKKEDLNNNKANEYLLVLEEKSERLKHLIEDLIEASKASSGNLAVALEKLDLIQLVRQSYGEYEDKLSINNLDVKLNFTESQIFISADGKHMWRILSNLLSNITKYALPNSRVYIDISKNSNYATLVIKNISAKELNIAPNLLTERFVRGDESRTTEGSGLGLAITQSLIQLQYGTFNIDIDGDLFKVTIEIPLWR